MYKNNTESFVQLRKERGWATFYEKNETDFLKLTNVSKVYKIIRQLLKGTIKMFTNLFFKTFGNTCGKEFENYNLNFNICEPKFFTIQNNHNSNQF